eukprot:3745954-Prymnesium_polylepis.1
MKLVAWEDLPTRRVTVGIAAAAPTLPRSSTGLRCVRPSSRASRTREGATRAHRWREQGR